jgi:hypothetical protein
MSFLFIIYNVCSYESLLLTPYVNEVSGFRPNTSVTDKIFSIPQTLRKEMGIQVGNTTRQSRRQVLYNIFIAHGIPMKLARLISMCLKETYTKAKVFSIAYSVQNIWKPVKSSSPFIFNFALEYAIRKVQNTRKD